MRALLCSKALVRSRVLSTKTAVFSAIPPPPIPIPPISIASTPPLLSAAPSAASPMVSVLEVTADGLTTKKQVTKSALLRISKIHTRDLLALFSFERKRSNPDFMVRDSAIIVCLSHIRAIIQHDRLFLFHPESDFVRSFVPQLITHLETPPKQIQLSNPYEYLEHEKVDFELRALEAILSFVCQTYRRRAMLIAPLVDGLTTRLGQADLSHDLLHQLLPMRDHLSEFEIELDTAETVLGSLLKNDEDLVGLLLTEKKRLRGQLPPLEAHRNVELMLENYTSQLVDISNEAYFLRKRVESIQSVAELNYGSQRNRLMHVTLKMSMASISISSMTAVAGFFGMNLPNGLEDRPVSVFCGVVALSSAMGAGLFFVMRASSLTQPPIASNDYESVFEHLDEIQSVLGNGEFVRKQSFQHAMAALHVSQDVADLLWDNSRIRPNAEKDANPELQRLFENTFIQRERSFKEERGGGSRVE